jgi:hypothetical protein
MDDRRLCGRVQRTLPSTLLCIAAGTSAAAAPLAPLSADAAPITESTGTSEKTVTLSSSLIGVSASAAATVTTSSVAASSTRSSESEPYEGSGEKDGGDEAMEAKEQSDGCEAHCDSDICTSPSSSSTVTLASSSSPSKDSEGSTTAVPNPVQPAVSAGHALCTGSLDAEGRSESWYAPLCS